MRGGLGWFKLIKIVPYFFGQLLPAFFAYFPLGNGNAATFTVKTGVGFDEAETIFPDKTVNFLDVHVNGLGDFLGGGAGPFGEIMKNLVKMVVFFPDASLADIPPARHLGKDPATAGTIGQTHAKVFWWGTVTCFNLW
jgi:hypothetical protein